MQTLFASCLQQPLFFTALDPRLKSEGDIIGCSGFHKNHPQLFVPAPETKRRMSRSGCSQGSRMPKDDQKAVYLQRAAEARSRATCASNFIIMDEYLDIAAAWRALAAEASQLEVRRCALEASAAILAAPPLTGARVVGRIGPCAAVTVHYSATGTEAYSPVQFAFAGTRPVPGMVSAAFRGLAPITRPRTLISKPSFPASSTPKSPPREI
jgi:hypothetical protein